MPRHYSEILLVVSLAALATASVIVIPENSALIGRDISPDTAAPSTDLVLRADSPRAAAPTALTITLRQEFLILSLIILGQRAWSAFTWAIGLFGLAASSYGVYKDCKQQYNTTECILASIGLVISAFQTGWKVKSGFGVRVRSDGLSSHAHWTNAKESRQIGESHIPIFKGGLKSASMKTKNNGTWERHATFYWDGEESHYLMYRRATAEDLGFENDGSFHHYRVEDSQVMKDYRAKIAKGDKTLGKRLEKRSYGVVSDYLWKNGNQDLFNTMHDSADFDDMARKTDKYLEDNKQEVSCLTPIGILGTHGGSSTSRVDNGIIAYGWNDQPYNFNGRAGAWADKCRGSNTG